ncbi:MAG: metal ABC transporter permease [Elusimicrobiota bacterium]
MNTFLEILKPDFLLHHAVWGSVVAGFVCPLVGVYVLLRRLIFWGVALPQVSAAGISCAFMLEALGLNMITTGEHHEKHLAIVGAVVFTLGAIILLAGLERRASAPSEGRLGVLYVLAAALSILFVSWNASGENEMLGLLKGEIVSISETDFHAMLDLFGLAAAAILLFQREFTLVSFDRDMAMTLGRSVNVWDGALFLIIGLTISLGVMTVGPLVIFGFLVIPPMAALPWARGMMSFSLLSSIIGGLSAFSGFYVSYTRDLPLGPMVVCVACAAYLLSLSAERILRRSP